MAAQAALAILRDGGNAIEAMVAAASTIAIVYPHMNGIGGDGFWVISDPGQPVVAIEACGPAAAGVSREFYLDRGMNEIPMRGPLSANTVAGTVSGWQQALGISARWGGKLPLARVLEDAIHYAENGIPVTVSQYASTTMKLEGLAGQPGFADAFLLDGHAPTAGSLFKQERLGNTLQMLVNDGLDSFYRGRLAEAIAADLGHLGIPVTRNDLTEYRARTRT
ncbi:MAG: gamma-glutamyltransferase, partial [Rhodoferax sp.]